MKRYILTKLFPTDHDIKIGDQFIPLYNNQKDYWINCRTGVVTNFRYLNKYPDFFQVCSDNIKKVVKKLPNDWRGVASAIGVWPWYNGTTDNTCYYDIQYSSSRNKYRLKCGGVAPKEHSCYKSMLKDLKELNKNPKHV